LKAKTITDLRWSLINNLLPFFAGHRLSEITPREVKRYTQAKLAERNAIEQARAAALAKGERFNQRPMSNGSINHTLRHLAQVLEEAVDDELLAGAEAAPAPDTYVIATSTGRRHNPSNLRRDVLFPAAEKANAKLAKLGIAPIGRIGFHALRRTCASLRCACGDDARYTADQLGHEDPRFTLRCYTQAAKRRDRLAAPHRKQFDRAIEWAALGTSDALTVPTFDTEATKSPV
jgi:transcriptional regulator with XRE-family HTH domain